ncbi:hypothetical protein L3Q82_003912 [Scortum barcoo]|uniref:Uncharacterized protein n=1 Tax=Scortum barcoo TaxID=214431 RepID=A0ACB8X7T8_9TELE|nr:hypothetical protein L3Q82_003912 [Scortum barcoo]
MALEEWRHWLEGSTQPFVVWTDHKNLAYIQTAKRLNSRQARWALFFSRFDFALTYRPGSRKSSPTPSQESSAWRRSHLSVPGRPWSHIALDFVTGLPPSNGKTVILTIVDRFSKAAHFVALAKLPTARETADLLANHVVRLHGIPRDIVSGSGSAVHLTGLEVILYAGLGASVSLTSGFHPQSNGQTERTNQDLESALRCVTAGNQSTWCTYLPWVELAHNSLEQELAVPSIQHHLQRCKAVWQRTQAALEATVQRNRRSADKHRLPAPQYSQDSWLRRWLPPWLTSSSSWPHLPLCSPPCSSLVQLGSLPLRHQPHAKPWKKEYVANITPRQCWHTPRRNVKNGDVVIVKEEELPRNEWRLGRVLDVCKDEDGLCMLLPEPRSSLFSPGLAGSSLILVVVHLSEVHWPGRGHDLCLCCGEKTEWPRAPYEDI